MNRLITFPIFLMLILAVLGLFIGVEYVVDETIEAGDFVFTFNTSQDISEYVYASLAGIIGAVIGVGINIFNSGLNDETVRTVTTLIIYTTIWTVLSIFTMDYFTTIPMIGWVLWGALSVIYVFGVGIEASEGGSSE